MKNILSKILLVTNLHVILPTLLFVYDTFNTVHIGFCDYGLSGQSGFSDRKPLDGPPSVHK